MRSNLQNTRPQDVRAQLNGMLEDVGFGRNPSPWDCSIWINAIKETLDEEQTKKWKAEQDARQEYRTHAVIGSVLYELDRRYRVSAAQMQQLEPMLKKVLADYEEDIRDYFSFDNGGWFLMSYYALLPVAGLEEKDAKSVFTAAQWKQWEAQDFPRLGNYWSNLKQNHENRMGRQKR